MFTLILIFNFAFSDSCDVYKRASQAGLDDNEKFWQELAECQAKNCTETELQELVVKHSAKPVVQPSAQEKSTSPVDSLRFPVVIESAAAKGARSLEPAIRKKLDKLVEILQKNGQAAITELRKGSWHPETVKEVDNNSIFVRLNQGFRAKLEQSGDSWRITEIGNDLYRH